METKHSPETNSFAGCFAEQHVLYFLKLSNLKCIYVKYDSIFFFQIFESFMMME